MAPSNEEADPALLLDRFVSASSGEDAYTSLSQILESLQSDQMAPKMIWGDAEIVKAMQPVLHTGKHKDIPVDEGASLVCRIYLQILTKEPLAPLLDDELLLDTLLDVISLQDDDASNNSSLIPMYARVLAIQLLTKICKNHPSKAQTKLLQAPNGLHRLGDLLQVSQEPILRNEALLLAQVIAEWPSCAKIWMFSEVADQVMLLAMEEGGLTGGNVLVLDCLDLLYNLWKHDPTLADLVFQSPTLTQQFPKLLDLRGGAEFLDPTKIRKKPKSATSPSTSAMNDDLDDILQTSASSSTPDKSPEDERDIPRLTSTEEQVIRKLLDILALLLQSESLRQTVWKKELGLCSLIWELALISPPPPSVPFVCALPSAELQQTALEVVAVNFNDPATMERHAGLDRLLFLVCTGGMGEHFDQRMGLSQAAMHVIRCILTVDEINQILLYTMAPPTVDEPIDEEPQPTVVQKLLNTVNENLMTTPATPMVDPERRKIFLAGGLGALSVFLRDQTSREVMLRLTTSRTAVEDDETSHSLVNSLLASLESNEQDHFICVTVLKFLCTWTVDTPSVVQAILSSSQSIVLNVLIQHGDSKVATMAKLLLGLSMEFIGDETRAGGWTTGGILEMISRKGVSRYTSDLEKFKTVKGGLPWSMCELEWKVWSSWYAECVLLVRKRVVHELTGGVEEDEDDDDYVAVDDAASKSDQKALHKMISQQTTQIESLEKSLADAEHKIASQETEINTMKRRVESAPTELDSMLSEFSNKNTVLEQRILELEKELLSKEESYKAEMETCESEYKQQLKKRDEEIQTLQSELTGVRETEKEARDENESMRSDLNSLSQAYASLEEEYRQQQAAMDQLQPQQSQQPGEQAAGEEATTTTETQGSTEMATLRAENSRLRQDATAADDWMTMAVQRMQAMGDENVRIQQELASLQEKASMSSGLSESLEQERQIRVALESQLVSARELEGQLQQERSQLEAQLSQARDEVVSLSTIKDDHNRLKQHLEDMTQQLQNGQEQIASLQKELDTVVTNAAEANTRLQADQEAFIASKESEVIQLKQQLEALKGQDSSENVMLKATIETLQQQLTAAQSNIESASERFQADQAALMSSKEQEMSQLQQQLAELSSQHASENAVLQATVETLQEQIATAHGNMEHVTQRFEADKAALTASKDDETAQLQLRFEQSISQHSSENATLKASVETLQQQLAAANASMENSTKREQEEIYRREAKIRELEAKIVEDLKGYTVADIESRDEEISQLRAANDAAQDWMAKVVEHHQAISDKMEALESEKTSLTTQLQDIQAKLVKSELAASKVNVLEQEASRMHLELKKLQTNLQTRDDELEQMKSTRHEELELARDEIVALKDQLQTLGTDASLQREKATMLLQEAQHMSQSHMELHSQLKLMKTEKEQLSQTLTVAQQANVEFASQIQLMKTETEELSGTLFKSQQSKVELESQLQLTLSQSASRLAEKEQEIKEMHVRLDEARKNLHDDEDCFDQWEGKNIKTGHHTSRVESSNKFTILPLTERVIELEKEVANLEKQLEDQESEASGAIAKWHETLKTQESEKADLTEALEVTKKGVSNEVEKVRLEENTRYVALQKQFDECRDQLAHATSKLLEDEKVVQEWEGRVADLEVSLKNAEDELDEQEAEAEKAISQWQDNCEQLQQQVVEAAESKATAEKVAQARGEEVAALEERLKRANEELVELKEGANEAADIVNEWEERVKELESALQSSENTLAEQEAEAEEAITKWQETCNDLEAKISELTISIEIASKEDSKKKESVTALYAKLKETEAELVAANQSNKEAEKVIDEWEARVSQLESAVGDLESQLEDQETEAADAIMQWQESYAALEQKNADLMATSLETEKEKVEETKKNENLGSTIAVLNQTVQEKDTQISSLISDLTEQAGMIRESQETISSLEGRIEDLQANLAKADEEATLAIANWKGKCETLEKEKSDLSHLVEKTEKSNSEVMKQMELKHHGALEAKDLKLKETQAALQQAEASLVDDGDVVRQWEERANKLNANIEDLERELDEQEEEANKAIKGWEESFAAVEAKNAELSSDKVKLQEQNTLLEVELQKATDDYKQVKEALTENEGIVHDWEGRASELQAYINSVEIQLKEHEKVSTSVISSWQESCAVAEAKNEELTKMLGQAKEENAMTLQQVKKEGAELVSNLETRVKEAEMVQLALETDKNEKVSVIQQLETRVAELQSRIEALDMKLKEKEEEAALAASNTLNVASQNAETLQVWESRVRELESQLQTAQDEIHDGQTLAAQNVETLRESEARIEELESQLRVTQGELDGSQTLAAQNGETLVQLKSRIQELESQVRVAQGELDDARAVATQNAETMREWESRVQDSESDIKGLEKQLREQEEEASSVNASWQESYAALEKQKEEAASVIASWQESYTALEKQNVDLTLSLTKMTDDLNKATEASEVSDVKLVESLRRQIEIKEELLQNLRNDFEEKSKTLIESEGRVDELEAKANDLAVQLSEQEELNKTVMNASKGDDELEAIDLYNPDEKEGLEDTIAGLESHIKDLEDQLEEQEKEANAAVSQWQESYVALEERNAGLSRELEASVEERDSTIRKQYDEHMALVSSLQAQLDEKTDLAFEHGERLGDTDDVQQLQEKILDLEATIEQLEVELDDQEKEATAVVAQWQESYASVESNNADLLKRLEDVAERDDELESEIDQTMLNALQSQLLEKENELTAKQAEFSSDLLKLTNENESLVQDLEKLKVEIVPEMKNQIEVLSSNASELMKQKEEAESSLKTLRDHCDEMNKNMIKLEESAKNLTGSRDDTSSLEATVEDLKGQLSSEREALSTLQSQLELSRDQHSQTKDMLSELVEQNVSLKTELEGPVEELKARYRELESVIEGMRDQQEERSNEASETIALWEKRCEEQSNEANEAIALWEKRCEELQELVNGSDAKREEMLRTQSAGFEEILNKDLSFKSQLLSSIGEPGHETENEERCSTLDELKVALADKSHRLLDAVNALRSDIDALTMDNSDLKEKLQESMEANKNLTLKTIKSSEAVKETSVADQQKIIQLEAEIGALSAKLMSSKSQDEETEKLKDENSRLMERCVELHSRLELSRIERSKMEQEINANKLYESDQYQELEHERDRLREGNADLEHEIEKQKARLNELEDELQEANSAMQVYVTSEICERATEMAADALRRQLDDLRAQLEADRIALQEERDRRENLEQETRRLKADLVALADLNESVNADDGFGTNVLTLRAAAKVQKKERSEINELRETLAQSTAELNKAKASEAESVERLSKTCLQLAASEEELSRAKSDLNFLIETLDDMRDSEATRRAAMEHRITSLENDHDVLRRFHSAELDSVRAELGQALMEKERILQALKDTEKKNASLLYSASMTKGGVGGNASEAELKRLRMEKAQLLASLAEEGSKMENRLRAMMDAQSSTVEADIILERELRVAAETSLENMMMALDELKEELEAVKKGKNYHALTASQRELDLLRNETKKKAEENDELRQRLDRISGESRDAKYQIEKLTEDSRMSQSKVQRLERELQFEREMKHEITRMQGTPSRLLDFDSAKENKEDNMPSEELYDMIHKQNDAIQNERELYVELLAEHDDLLAVLAQHDAQMKSMMAALFRHAGQPAVDAAIHDAESLAMEQFGKFVRLT